MKLTNWYPGTIKPVRVGPYQRKYRAGIQYCWFDGRHFYGPTHTRKNAASMIKDYGPSIFQNLPWRGVAK